MRKTLKDLFLAMLNATLILVVVALLLLVLLLTKANSLSETFAQSLVSLEPLEAGIETINSEASKMKAEIALLKQQSQGISFTKLDELEAKLGSIETHLAEIKGSMSTLAETPDRLVNTAVASAADYAVGGAARLRGCVPAGTE
ncbi:hypothetical protein C1J03_15810 [Sulfitobacter sp. SK012]|uniref:hypothetical protein n=1 Tax=Sulfitobacter sp. SK012 TaxID=1389005 RepID=UPI000E0C2A78|nr:hypothetical protein [Sulfitobacter sp. SK012]AXI47345.1 hypothetical protein C1J03_15810 [Sulfitobacter sp. SK012]